MSERRLILTYEFRHLPVWRQKVHVWLTMRLAQALGAVVTVSTPDA